MSAFGTNIAAFPCFHLGSKRTLSGVQQLRPALKLNSSPPDDKGAERSQLFFEAHASMRVLLPVLRLPQSQLDAR